MEKSKNRFLLLENLCFILLFFVLSYYFTILRFSLNIFYGKIIFEMVLDIAKTPWQYRILIPHIVKFFMESFLLFNFSIPQTFSLILLFYRIIGTFSLFFLVVTFRIYINLFFKNIRLSNILSLTIFYVLPFNFLNTYWYPYDIPSVLFFTIGLILLYKKDLLKYYLFFTIATLNKETTCFLTFIYLFTSIGKERPKKIFINCFLQFIIWSIIKISLYKFYSQNPGFGYFEKQILNNLKSFLNFKDYFYLFSCFGYIWIPTILFIRFIDNDFVKKSLFVIPLFLFGMMFAGGIFELRIYGELIPVVLTGFLIILKNLFITHLTYSAENEEMLTKF
jgi:hypothetical protein